MEPAMCRVKIIAMLLYPCGDLFSAGLIPYLFSAIILVAFNIRPRDWINIEALRFDKKAIRDFLPRTQAAHRTQTDGRMCERGFETWLCDNMGFHQ